MASGCTGGSDETTDPEDDAAAYCAETAELDNIEDLLSPDSIRDPSQVENAFTSFRASLRDIEDTAPAEIEDDLATLGSAVDDAVTTLGSVGFDILALDEATAQELIAVFERPGVRRASTRIEAYDTLNCASVQAAEPDVNASDDQSTAVPPDEGSSITVDPSDALAFEYAELISSTFSEDEIASTLEFAEVDSISALVAAIQAGDVTVDEIDLFLQRRSDGVPYTFGDDSSLDVLWNACEADDWAACDGLYEGSPLQSLYQRFAATCGQELDAAADGECVERFGE